MDLTLALNLIVKDAQDSFPWMNAANAARYVRDTVCPCCLDGEADDPNRLAYAAVLTATESDLAMAVSVAVDAGLTESDIRQSPITGATIGGEPALEWLEQLFGEDEPA